MTARSTGRPEALFPLFADLKGLDGVGPKTAEALTGAGIATPRDLLFTLPHSGIDRTRQDTVKGLVPPAMATVEVMVGRHYPPRTKGRPYRVEVTDAAMTFQLVFFHANPGYLERQLPPGERRVISGKLEIFDGVAQIVHPDHMLPPEEAEAIPVFEPVYPLTQGVTQRVMGKAAAGALDRAPDLPEWIDPALCQREGWPAWQAALEAAHGPGRQADLASTVARPPAPRL